MGTSYGDISSALRLRGILVASCRIPYRFSGAWAYGGSRGLHAADEPRRNFRGESLGNLYEHVAPICCTSASSYDDSVDLFRVARELAVAGFARQKNAGVVGHGP